MNYRAMIRGMVQARILQPGKNHTPQQPEYLVTTPIQIHTHTHTEEIGAQETLIVYSPDKDPCIAIYRPTHASFLDVDSINVVSIAAAKVAAQAQAKKVLPHEAAGFNAPQAVEPPTPQTPQ